MTIAALFVEKGGVYFGLPDVDPWDETRDARLYDGPYPVVAHPPCQRWGRYWHGGPSAKVRRVKGDDGGCFAAALAAVRRWGGVLEHPEASAAWKAFGLLEPPHDGTWVAADWLEGWRGWTCCVEQGWFGHRMRKKTWLYAHGVDPLSAPWGRAKGQFLRMDQSFHSVAERAAATEKKRHERIRQAEIGRTPIAFRDFLLKIALTSNWEMTADEPPMARWFAGPGKGDYWLRPRWWLE